VARDDWFIYELFIEIVGLIIVVKQAKLCDDVVEFGFLPSVIC
jgi:hypothetical protein